MLFVLNGRGQAKGAVLFLFPLVLAATALPDYGQFPGERQRFRVLGVARTYTTSQSWVEVRYADLAHNAATVLSHLAPGSIPLAIVKGNAYGHGLDFAANVFLDAGFKEFGVADINEAITLRQEGFEAPIHIMNQPDYLTARVMALEDVQVHLETLDFARALCQETMAVKRQAPMQVHVKVAAAGAGFQGVQSVEEAMELIEYVGTCPSLELRGITADQHSSVEELQRFAEELRAAGARIGITGITAGPQLLRTKDYEVDIVHVGGPLYGQQEVVSGTRPAAQWLTRILSLKQVKVGDVLHDSHRSKHEMVLATIQPGFSDANLVEEVLINGKVCKRLDSGTNNRATLIDVTSVPDVKVGDAVLLQGVDDEENELRRPWTLAAVSISVPRIPKWD